MSKTMMMMIEIAGVALLAIPFAYALFRAAALGWFRTKLEYQRRLMSGLKQESCSDGKYSNHTTR